MKYVRFAHLDPPTVAKRLALSPRALTRILFRSERVFTDSTIKNKTILEIGAGDGALSCLLSLAGARSVTALEPQGAGADRLAIQTFTERIRTGRFPNVALITKTLQDWPVQTRAYDWAVSVNSVNHWDEQACINLHRDPQARKVYGDMFWKIHASLVDEGRFLFCDVGKWNFFSWPSNHLGLKNPMGPSIQWFKHQQPFLWARLLQKAGFRQVAWKWLFHLPPFRIAQVLLDNPCFHNPVAAYFSASEFFLSAVK